MDYYAKKLQGELLFKLLLHCLLTHKDNSLRSVASAYESAVFGALNSVYLKDSVRYNAISRRLTTINADYFKKIYQHCIRACEQLIGAEEGHKLLRFDSTIVALSEKLLSTVGYNLKGGGAQHLRQIKFTVGLGQLPQVSEFYSSQSHNSENRALKDAIISNVTPDTTQVVVFDRGITSRATYDLLTSKGIRFVSRINVGAKHESVSNNRLAGSLGSGRLIINVDRDVQLFSQDGKRTKGYLRCVKAVEARPAADKAKELWFITNIGEQDLDAGQVAEVYRRRWDIEVFFKFIKQHLNFSHLMNRSENGIHVMLYMTMTAATLVMAYRKLKGKAGFKIVKQQLAQELETEMLKTIITLCGGNPEQLDKILKPNSS